MERLDTLEFIFQAIFLDFVTFLWAKGKQQCIGIFIYSWAASFNFQYASEERQPHIEDETRMLNPRFGEYYMGGVEHKIWSFKRYIMSRINAMEAGKTLASCGMAGCCWSEHPWAQFWPHFQKLVLLSGVIISWYPVVRWMEVSSSLQ